MGCERFERELIDVAAGGPPPAAVQTHLEECVRCHRRLQEHRRVLDDVDGLLRARLQERPSPRLAARVASRRAEGDARGWRRAAVVAGLAAGLGMAILAGWAARRPPDTPAEPGKAMSSIEGQSHGSAARPSPAVGTIGVRPPGGPARAVVPPVVRTASRDRAGYVREAADEREPVVLVPPGQDEALRRFAASLLSGTRPVPPLLMSSTSVESLVELAPLMEIPPLEARPLDDPATPLERSDS